MGVNGVGSGWTAIGPSDVDVTGIETGWMNRAVEVGVNGVGSGWTAIGTSEVDVSGLSGGGIWVAEGRWASVAATLEVVM